LLKNSECKKYIPYSEKFLGNSVFQARSSKILNDKKYMFKYSENIRATLFFRASACKLLRNSEFKKYIPYRETFRGNSVFQGKHRLLKTPE